MNASRELPRHGRAVGAAIALALAGCGEVRETAAHAPDWELDLRPTLTARCGSCHSGAAPAGGWSVARYTDALSCVAAADAGVDGGVDVATRLRRALDRSDHAAYVDARLRGLVDAWVAGGARPRRGAMHDPGFVDPRSPSFHARVLRAARWAPMLDGTRQDACGRCHEGTPSRPRGVSEGAPAAGATACTTCHDAPAGVLDCATCHGEGRRPWPGPTCLAPPDARPTDAHARHVVAGATLLSPLSCTACHPARDTNLSSGSHGDGVVDVRFDPALAGPSARYEASTGACSVGCHAATPSSPAPRWRQPQTATPCAGCHETPPRNHWPGPCTTCHVEPNATGTALTANRLHLNGRVDVGDGSGTCSACHGRDGDPWPLDATHRAHRDTTLTTPVACSECHEVPATVTAPGHLDDRGAGDLRFGARALARGSRATFEAGTCASVACHGEGLIGRSSTRVAWRATSSPGCDGCHGTPPPRPHTASASCENVICHGAEVERVGDALRLLPSGRAAHIDGVTNAGVPR